MKVIDGHKRTNKWGDAATKYDEIRLKVMAFLIGRPPKRGQMDLQWQEEYAALYHGRLPPDPQTGWTGLTADDRRFLTDGTAQPSRSLQTVLDTLRHPSTPGARPAYNLPFHIFFEELQSELDREAEAAATEPQGAQA